MGIGDVFRRSAANFPDKNAIIFEDQRITYRELNRRVNRIANGLLRLGLQQGDRVAVLLHNGPEFIEIYFACAKSGVDLRPGEQPVESPGTDPNFFLYPTPGAGFRRRFQRTDPDDPPGIAFPGISDQPRGRPSPPFAHLRRPGGSRAGAGTGGDHRRQRPDQHLPDFRDHRPTQGRHADPSPRLDQHDELRPGTGGPL